MNIWLLLFLILLIAGAFGGSLGGFYPHTVGIGGGTILIIVLVVLVLSGRL